MNWNFGDFPFLCLFVVVSVLCVLGQNHKTYARERHMSLLLLHCHLLLKQAHSRLK